MLVGIEVVFHKVVLGIREALVLLSRLERLPYDTGLDLS